ncbi:MAG: hypothetical protein A2637_07670 [Candidatus Muproteobacteria bacterium RIFCSPHIGHO2_01_FULL_65_16]|uniref:Lipoprotein n=1 Tax=Candidatus Muproteobacteria bacterium RIFCSPHIGHO2_01_FULL_65_16 TaxID=1817764 RepID=A0A1F6TL79_9PROT|nr:MAG: hypothetical protein A2637_07670 [Candidatus Muproteobacteria bacterium RIFCSPHIGHO2_01_FULL_65_16]
MITKTGGLALLVPALLLSACLSVPIELKVNPTLTADGANLSTIQFKERDREKAFRVIREFARGQRMEPLPPGKSVLGAGWAQEQHQLRVKVSGLLYDTEHTIILTLLYKDGNATVQLLHDGKVPLESSQIELALLDTLRGQFGANNVEKIGG